MLTALALALTPSVTPPPAASPVAVGPVAVGPPALCHPVHIGAARSLPWDGPGGFDRDKSYDITSLVADTQALLASSDDPLVHMETLRRAAVYVFRPKGDQKKRAKQLAESLVAELRKKTAEASQPGEPPTRRAALHWFDLGYAQGVLRQAGYDLGDGGRDALAQAAKLLPNDASVFLGRSLALWNQKGCHPLRDLDKAVRLAEDRKGPIRQNLVEAGSFFLDARTYDQLVAKLERELGQG